MCVEIDMLVLFVDTDIEHQNEDDSHPMTHIC